MRRTLLAALAAVLTLPAAAGAAPPANAPTAAVSLGDSYISGEAGRWQGNSNNASGDRDGTDRAAFNCTPVTCSYDASRVYGASDANNCHRSDVAEIRLNGIPADRKINIACSGATTEEVFRAANGGKEYKGEAPQADQLAAIANTHRVRAIVLSIGGNDLGFAAIVQDCLTRYVSSQPPCEPSQQAALDSKFQSAMGNVGKAIREIRAVMSAAGYDRNSYRLIGQSYPSVFARAAENRFPEADRTRASIGGCPFYDSDSNWARDRVVNQIANGLRFVYAFEGVQFLDLRDAFQGRELCSKTTQQASVGSPPGPRVSEWGRFVQQGSVIQGELQESVHPNLYGQLAMGRCLTLVFNSFSRGIRCLNVPGSGPEGMRAEAF